MDYRNVMKRIMDLRYSNSALCDISIKSSLGGKVIHAHKIILAGCCEYFEALFKNDLIDNEILIHSIPADVIEIIIDYMYSSELNVEEDEALQDVLMAADYLGLTSLIIATADKLKALLNFDNCVILLNLSKTIYENGLCVACLEFICSNLTKLRNQILDCPFDSLISVINSEYFDKFLYSVSIDATVQERWLLELIVDYLMKNDLQNKVSNSLFSLIKWPVIISTKQPSGIVEFEKDNIIKKVTMDDFSSSLVAKLKHERINCYEQIFKFISLAHRYVNQINNPSDHEQILWPDHWKWMREFSNYQILMSSKCAFGGETNRRREKEFQVCAQIDENLTHLLLRFRIWDNHEVFAGFILTYDSGRKCQIGLTGPFHVFRDYSIELDTGEFICGCKVTAGWFVDSFQFSTSIKPSLVHYGGDGGGLKIDMQSNDYQPLKLVGFSGLTCKVDGILIITNFQLSWATVGRKIAYDEWKNNYINVGYSSDHDKRSGLLAKLSNKFKPPR